MDEKILTFKRMINESSNVVFFGGAGVSTESGIPDFRSADGLYLMNYKYPPEEIISHSFFKSHTKEFFEFYRKYFNYPNAKPNTTHLRIAELEKEGKISAVITQNIDGLHAEAGSKNVLELHGSVHRNYCMKCGKFHEISAIISSEGIPLCDCGGIIKPDVVLYEEQLCEDTINRSVEAIKNADMLIVAGTSLRVYPAAGFIQYFRGKNLVLINKDSTPMDSSFGLIINESLGDVFAQI